MMNYDSWRINDTYLIKQGAEARLYKIRYDDDRDIVVKERFSKRYRHPTLDKKITDARIKGEVRCMLRARSLGVRTPAVFSCDLYTNRIYMEYIDGMTARDALFRYAESPDTRTDDDSIRIARDIGRLIGKLHDGDMIHGDLTTSNILIDMKETLILIDFGLSYMSTLIEDKAVDLYVLERAILSTHANSQTLFDTIILEYDSVSKHAKKVIKRLNDVRARGRKKDMFG